MNNDNKRRFWAFWILSVILMVVIIAIKSNNWLPVLANIFHESQPMFVGVLEDILWLVVVVGFFAVSIMAGAGFSKWFLKSISRNSNGMLFFGFPPAFVCGYISAKVVQWAVLTMNWTMLPEMSGFTVIVLLTFLSILVFYISMAVVYGSGGSNMYPTEGRK